MIEHSQIKQFNTILITPFLDYRWANKNMIFLDPDLYSLWEIDKRKQGVWDKIHNRET